MKKNSLTTKGFTLIEIMVATSIFMVVMLMAMGALVTTSHTAKKAQALRTAMDNVNFAMESMTRTLRMGQDYSGGGTYINFTPPVPSTAPPPAPGSSAFALSGGVLNRCDGGTCIPMTSESVSIDYLQFYITGADPADYIQPSVYIALKGVVTVKGETSQFALQTIVSQRSVE
jgi:type II secretory pathway pseudopilin PulG